MLNPLRLALACTVMALTACAGVGGTASPSPIATETFMVDSDAGIRIHVRNKHSVGQSSFIADKVVIFVHGATYPGTAFFDADLPGGSWMDYAAARGFDTYSIDVRGYGGSTRPAAMNQPPAGNAPFADTAEAVRDLGAVVDFVRKRRGVDKVNLVGWSWGTTITAGYTTQNNDKVNKLALHAPIWTLGSTPVPISGSGSYRVATQAAVRSRGLRGIPAAKVEEVSPTSWYDRWWAQLQATDPEGAKLTPPGVRAPNGVLKDVGLFWSAGKGTYDPAAIRVPTLLIVGEWDQDTPVALSQALFPLLVNTPYRRMEVLSEGTHTIGLEKNRMQLVGQVQNFLEEKR